MKKLYCSLRITFFMSISLSLEINHICKDKSVDHMDHIHLHTKVVYNKVYNKVEYIEVYNKVYNKVEYIEVYTLCYILYYSYYNSEYNKVYNKVEYIEV